MKKKITHPIIFPKLATVNILLPLCSNLGTFCDCSNLGTFCQTSGARKIFPGGQREQDEAFSKSLFSVKKTIMHYLVLVLLSELFLTFIDCQQDAFLCQSSSECIGGLSSALSGAFMVALLILLSITLITKQSIPSTGAAQEIISFISVRNCRRRIPASRYCKELSRLTSGCPLFPHLIHSILQFTVRVHQPLHQGGSCNSDKVICPRSLRDQMTKSGLAARFSDPKPGLLVLIRQLFTLCHNYQAVGKPGIVGRGQKEHINGLCLHCEVHQLTVRGPDGAPWCTLGSLLLLVFLGRFFHSFLPAPSPPY